MADPEGKIALLAGASGLVGSHLLDSLLGAPEFSRVFAVSRRALGREHARLANRIVQFDRLESQLKGLNCHGAFCCLGSRSGTDSSELVRIEREHVLAFARAARAAGAERFVFLSCAGADARARRPQLSLKADAERALEALGFTSLDILQPGPLLGMRREVHLGELAGMLGALCLGPFLRGAREAHRPLPATTVAQAMLGAWRSGRRGLYRYTHSGIRTLASARPGARPAPAPAPAPRTRRGA